MKILRNRWPRTRMATTWLHGWGRTRKDRAVFARRFTANGSPMGSEFRVSTSSNLEFKQASIAVSADGVFVVAWARAAVFTAERTTLEALRGPEFLVPLGSPLVYPGRSIDRHRRRRRLCHWLGGAQSSQSQGLYFQKIQRAWSNRWNCGRRWRRIRNLSCHGDDRQNLYCIHRLDEGLGEAIFVGRAASWVSRF